MVKNSNSVIELFGYWPDFSDGKIIHFSYTQSGLLEITVHYIDSAQKKEANIDLLFEGVSNLRLSDFFSENVVDLISINNENPITVTINACYGLAGTFQCQSARVTNVDDKH